jgi:hypothetical protein
MTIEVSEDEEQKQTAKEKLLTAYDIPQFGMYSVATSRIKCHI